jgi:hypothetical protein
MRRILHRALVPALGATALLCVATPAFAAPVSGPTGGTVATDKSAALSVADVAPAGRTVSASLGGGASTLTLPVAGGLTPTKLTARFSPAYSSGAVTVISIGNRVAARLTGTATQTIDIPLTAADLVTTTDPATIPLSVTVVPATTTSVICADPTVSAVVDQVALQTTGTAVTPTSVATFLDTTVDAINVVLPAGTSTTGADGVATAGLQAVASLTHRWGAAGTNTATVGLAVGDAARPAGARNPRLIVLKAGSNATGTTLTTTDGVPTLTVTGNAAGLLGAVRSLDSDALALADSSDTSGLDASYSTGNTGSNTKTLQQISGSPTVNLAGFGLHTNYIGIDQTAFSGPVAAVKVHLQATTSAVAQGTQARFSVYWNDQLLSSQMLASGQPIDTDLTVPSGRIQRQNGLVLQMDALPSNAGCTADGLPAQVTVDSVASTVSVETGQTLPIGFGRFPQALSGTLPVAFGTDTTDLLPGAGEYVAALQGASANPLTVSTVTAESFVSGATSTEPGLLVAATPDQVAALGAPLRVGAFRQLTGTTPLTVTSNTPVAALQAFQNGSRDVLLTAAWAPDGASAAALAQQLADRAAGRGASATGPNAGGWTSLNSDLTVATAAGVSTLDSTSLAPQAQILQEHNGIPWWVWAIAGAVVLAALLRWQLTSRRRRAVSRYLDAEQNRAAEADLATAGVRPGSTAAENTGEATGSDAAGGSSDRA